MIVRCVKLSIFELNEPQTFSDRGLNNLVYSWLKALLIKMLTKQCVEVFNL